MSTPMISSVAPSAGPASGGTQISIAGSGFSAATDVLFGTLSVKAGSGILSLDDSLILLESPASPSSGFVDLTVMTPNGNAAWLEGYDYIISIDNISPSSGTAAGGTQVVITGSGMLQVTGVLFGGLPATAINVASNGQQIVATTPSTIVAGSVDITLTAPNGDLDYVDGFTYVAVPTVTVGGGTGSGTGTSTGTSTGTNTGTGTGTGAGTGTSAGAGATTTDGTGTNSNTSTTGNTNPSATSPGQTTNPAGKNNTKNPPAQANSTTESTDTTSTNSQPANPGTSAPPGNTKAPASQPPAQTVPPAPPSSPASTNGPNAGNYIPGGAMIVPEGKTGLGGTAGTGQGFGMGTLMAGGGGSASASNLQYYVDPGISAQLVQTLIGLVQTAASPDAIESQNMILRRMALEGDVIGSRIPPPRNISEIGGYLNLLTTLKEDAMREQTLAGILGVAGPAQPLGWISNTQPLAMVAITNDRPAVPAKPSFPLTVLVRNDFVSALQSAQKSLHSYGVTLPLVGPSVITLPPGGTGATVPQNPLFYIGRTISIAPNACLINPAGDPIILMPPANTSSDYLLVAQVMNTGTFTVAPVDIQAVQCTPTTRSIIQLNQVRVVPIGATLGAAGFYSPSPFPAPANSTVTSWATLTNITGLVAGQTKLGDELSLLYRQDQIAHSALASMLSWTWNGSAFAP